MAKTSGLQARKPVDHSQIGNELRRVRRDILKPYSPEELGRLFPFANEAHKQARTQILLATPRLFTFEGRQYGMSATLNIADLDVFSLLTIDEVMPRVGMRKPAIYAAIKEGTFPAPYTGTNGRPRLWREIDIYEYENELSDWQSDGGN